MSINLEGNDLSDQPLIETATFRVSEPVDGTRRRRRSLGQKAGPSPLTRITVDPGVWKAAMRLAGGNRQRIEVRSATEVVVR